MFKNLLLALPVFLMGISAYSQNYPKARATDYQIEIHDTIIKDPYAWFEQPAPEELDAWLTGQQKLIKSIEKKQKYQTDLTISFRKTRQLFTSEKIDSIQLEKNELKQEKEDYAVKFRWRSYGYDSDLYYRGKGARNFKLLYSPQKESRKVRLNWGGVEIDQENGLVYATISEKGKDHSDLLVFDLKGEEPQILERIENLFINTFYPFKDGVVYEALIHEDNTSTSAFNSQQLIYKPLGKVGRIIFKLNNLGENQLSNHQVVKNTNSILIHYPLKIGGKNYQALSLCTVEEDANPIKNLLIYPYKGKNYFNGISINQENQEVLVQTDFNAPNGQLLKLNIQQTNKVSLAIPQQDMELNRVHYPKGSNYMVLVYNNHGRDVVKIYDREFQLVKSFQTTPGETFTRFIDKGSYGYFRLDNYLANYDYYKAYYKDWAPYPVHTNHYRKDVEHIEVEHFYATSKDGLDIPFYAVSLGGLKNAVNRPTWMNIYGGYGTELTPSKDPYSLDFILKGGVFILPNIRGSGGYSKSWEEQGKGKNKGNAVKDIASVAEFLQENGHSNPEKFVISGGSHGGLIVSSAGVKYPELFSMVIATAAPLDLLSLENYSTGSLKFNTDEFGSIKDKEMFQSMLRYSPLHQISPNVEYPIFLISTGSEDTRVPPFHSYKFAASLQENAKPSSQPRILFYQMEDYGHNDGDELERWDYQIFYMYHLYDHLDLPKTKKWIDAEKLFLTSKHP